jgi:hypothetical protein
MWFDAQAELAKLGGGRESDACPPATLATSATLRPRVAIVADVAAPPATSATTTSNVATPCALAISTQCETTGGRVTTWTARVVSLDEWKRLAAWQRYGSNGRRWCGINQCWE